MQPSVIDKNRIMADVDCLDNLPTGFFDGAEQNSVCGCRAILVLEPGIFYAFSWCGGRGTTSKAEVMALWDLFTVHSGFHIGHFPSLEIPGSQLIGPIINLISTLLHSPAG